MTEPRKGLREAIDALPFRRMTGAGLDEGGTTGDLSCDYDEWLDVVSKDDVLALAATPANPAGLDEDAALSGDLDAAIARYVAEYERLADHDHPARCGFEMSSGLICDQPSGHDNLHRGPNHDR